MEFKHAFFIGIGGIGMSALAQYLLDHGVAVSGSDREASPVTDLLELKGVQVVIGQKAENIPTDADVIVYSDAVHLDNPERMAATRRGIPQLSYFAMLGKVSEGKRTVAVAGTHGKTTTTGMLAKILSDVGVSPTAIVGSIVRDFSSNYLHGDSDRFVVEACEYKNHLLELSPEILVVTNIEWDHTDFFHSLQDMQDSFRRAMEKVPVLGAIVTDATHPNIAPLLQGVSARVVDYTKGSSYKLLLPGEFNVMNARAAAAAAKLVQPTLSEDAIEAALATFKGTWRRFEYKGKTAKGADVYDDYAHHPTAIAKTLATLREKSKGKVYVAFHPHLYSRTRDLLEDFVVSFKDADEVFIAPIYAAREDDDGTISSTLLADRIRENGTRASALSFEDIEKKLKSEPGVGDVIITMGAGDIYKVADAVVVAH